MTNTTLIAIALSVPLLISPPAPEPAAEAAAGLDLNTEIFYAVLEGLYTDGVKNDVVDRLLMKDSKGGYLHFIAGCPLCVPAKEAIRHYRQRPEFVSFKTDTNTWGNGLSAATREAVFTGDLKARLDTLMGLIERWVGRRVELRRLTPKERQEWDHALEDGRKTGMAVLQAAKSQGLMPEWAEITQCAVCDGSNLPFGK